MQRVYIGKKYVTTKRLCMLFYIQILSLRQFFFHTAETAETTTFAAVKHEKRNWDLSKGISLSPAEDNKTT